MTEEATTPPQPRRTRRPVAAALTAAVAVALVAALAVAGGLPGSAPGAAAPTTAPAAPDGSPSAGQGAGVVDVGWVAPAGKNGNTAPAFGSGSGRGHKIGAITITKIDGAKLSLETADGWTRTIDATGATITRDGATIAVGDLAVGDEIALSQQRQADGTYKITAVLVILPKVTGTITAIASSSLTLAAGDGTKTTVNVTLSTTYRLGKDTVDKSAVKVGMQAVVVAIKAADGTLTATSVTVKASQVAGTITAIASSSLTLAAGDGTKTTVNVTLSTTYRLGKDTVDKSAVKVGMQAAATGLKAADGTLTATSVTVRASRLAGTVTATSGSTITVTAHDGSKVTVNVTSSTTYRVAGVANAALKDVKVDVWIVAEGLRNTDGSFAASAVQATAAGKHGGWRGWGDWMPNDAHPGGSDDASPAPAGTQVPSSNG